MALELQPAPSKTAELQALVIFAIVLLTLRAFAIFHLSEGFLGGTGGDSAFYQWLCKHAGRDFFRLPWFQTRGFYPYDYSLAWSDNFLLPGLFISFLSKLTGLAAAWNATLLLAQLLNAWSIWLLARRLGANATCAIFGGAAFLGLGYFSEHLGHPQLQFFFMVPLAIAYLLRCAGKAEWAPHAGFIICLLGAFCSTVYFAIFIAIITIFLVPLLWLSGNRFNLKKSALSFCVGAVLLTPFILPYLGVKEAFGDRGLHEYFYFSLSLGSIFAAPATSAMYFGSSPYSHSEAHFFPGFLLLIGAALALQWHCRSSKYLQAAFMVMLLGYFFADPMAASTLHIARPIRLPLAALCSWSSPILALFAFVRTKASARKHLILPCLLLFLLALGLGPLGYEDIGIRSFSFFRGLYAVVPGLDAVRAISRLGTVCWAVAIVLLALYCSEKRVPVYALFLLMICVLFENKVSNYAFEKPAERPEIFNRVAYEGGPLLVLPLTSGTPGERAAVSWSTLATYNVHALLWSEDSRAYVNGYSGQRTRLINELPLQLARFPDNRSLKALSEIGGLESIVILGSQVENFNSADFESRLAQFPDCFSIEAKEGTDYLLSFKPLCYRAQQREVLIPSYAHSLQIRATPGAETHCELDGENISLTEKYRLPGNRQITPHKLSCSASEPLGIALGIE